MTMLLRALALVGSLAVAGHAFAQITLFEHDDFRGRRVSIDDPVADLRMSQYGIGDRASSASVRGGTWQVCADVEFRGRCVTLTPGDYRSFESMGMNDRVMSVRQVGGPAAPPQAAGPARGGRIVLNDYTNFAGRSLALDRDVIDFNSIGFNDRAISLIVESGTWLLCEHAEFRGQCITLRPGRYIDLADMNQRISSARLVDGGGGPVAAAPPPRPPQARGAVLFGQRGMQGRSVAVDRPVVRNLEELGFNDRATSLRVVEGYWLFCSDANFEGECRTFGPGDYPSLPPELNNRISSARRISNEYPYRENPRWR